MMELEVEVVVVEVVEDDEIEERGTVPVGSSPRALFRLARGHPDALKKNKYLASKSTYGGTTHDAIVKALLSVGA